VDERPAKQVTVALGSAVFLLPSRSPPRAGFLISALARAERDEDSIREKVAARVAQYDGQWDAWLRSTFDQALERIDVGLLSWRDILAFLLAADSDTVGLREFYARGIRFNPLSGRRSVARETPTAESIEAATSE
jgi:hypothetical protein